MRLFSIHLIFESDEEFTEFSLDPFAVIEKDRLTGNPRLKGELSVIYKILLEQGYVFVIMEKNSKVCADKCISKRVAIFSEKPSCELSALIQLPVENVVEGDESFMLELKKKYIKSFFDLSMMCFFDENDKGWLVEMAENGNINAICCLIVGIYRKYRSVSPDFFKVNEEGEVILELVPLSCLIDGTTFEQEEGELEHLIQMLYDAKEQMGDDELLKVSSYLKDKDKRPFYLELLRRGIIEVEQINDIDFLIELCDKGDKRAAYQLYRIYSDVDEMTGLCLDREKAQYYFKLASEE